MKHQDFDVIVVGGGHAGTEAALAAHRMGVRVALITHRFDRLGEMSCNPAIGGLGKGHIVREIDALDGIMGHAADAAGIQYRLLNRKKGPAAQGPRIQADRALYRSAIQSVFRQNPDLVVIEGEVTDLVVKFGTVRGVVVAGQALCATGVVLTTGTFLRGMIHEGDQTRPAGRVGDPASIALARRIESLGLPLGRLKTGTPPRLDGRTINWSVVEMQAGDEVPTLMSFLSTRPPARQISCGVSHTSEAGHEIIRANLGRSALFGGQITGIGPRYCPSIEDKVTRFAEKQSHQVFLEPEGLDDHLVYPNGISTSLPADVQIAFVRTMQGLENVDIIRPGYAIEYDYIDPRALDLTLAVKALPGLFLAGQINGTTGYEEAAGQGLIAGLNAAALASRVEPLILNRSESYIGVMIDDLVTRGVTEPYRMFTSRAEYRLHLRADNADQRLTPRGIAFGCVGEERQRAFDGKKDALELARVALRAVSLTPPEAEKHGIALNQDGIRRTLEEIIAISPGSLNAVRSVSPAVARVAPEILAQLQREAVYAPYLARQMAEAEQLIRDEGVALPATLDYASMSGLSNELRGKLKLIQPRTLGQAGRIEGMTPAALTLLLMRARQEQALRAAS